MSRLCSTMTICIGLILFCVLLVPIDSSADSKADNEKKGWWWYKYEVEEEKSKEESETRKKTYPSIKDYTREELWNMHPDDFQALLQEIQKKAVMTLKEEDVVEYQTMIYIANQKASAFAAVSGMVAQKNPGLTVESDVPVTAPGRKAKVRQQNIALQTKIAMSQDNFALIYFYRVSCPYCAAQEKILDMFTEKYGWKVKGVDIEENPGLANQFNVEIVPFILLIQKGNEDSIPISSGVISLNDIEHRIYRGIRLLSGEVTPEQFHMYEFQDGRPIDPQYPLQTELKTK